MILRVPLVLIILRMLRLLGILGIRIALRILAIAILVGISVVAWLALHGLRIRDVVVATSASGSSNVVEGRERHLLGGTTDSGNGLLL